MPFGLSLKSTYLSYLSVLLISLSIPIIYHILTSSSSKTTPLTATQVFHTSPDAMLKSTLSKSPPRMPVYFLGIGGPNFAVMKDHPAVTQMAAIGHEITTKIKPKAILVISAHWQAGPNKIEINVAEKMDIIYDFSNFPQHYYEMEYPNKGSPEIAERVAKLLEGRGLSVERARRGLDHGVWAGFIVAFNPKINPLKVPIIQLSLLGSDDPAQHYRLGEILSALRDEGILIVGAGMAVHNLYDFRAAMRSGKAENIPYALTFDEALKEAATSKPDDRQAKMLALMQTGDAKKAHPSTEHILPLFVAAGAAGGDVGKRLWSLVEGSVSWASYRFGDVVE